MSNSLSCALTRIVRRPMAGKSAFTSWAMMAADLVGSHRLVGINLGVRQKSEMEYDRTGGSGFLFTIALVVAITLVLGLLGWRMYHGTEVPSPARAMPRRTVGSPRLQPHPQNRTRLPDRRPSQLLWPSITHRPPLPAPTNRGRCRHRARQHPIRRPTI
jgi:hypothetical protein